MLPDGLATAVAALPSSWQGYYFDEVDSTQDQARAAAGRGAAARSIFVADYQRAGRGRQGRTWLAEPGLALLASMVFRDQGSAPVPWRWTSLASVSLVEAIRQIVPTLRPAIKWPNDVLLDDRKVAGILAESTWDGRQLLAVVGVGLNVRSDEAHLALVPGRATSLRVAAGQDVDRGDIVRAFVARMDSWLSRPASELHGQWESQLWGRGQRLRMLDVGAEEDVVVLGADLDGSLRVRLPNGTERRTTTGELIV